MTLTTLITNVLLPIALAIIMFGLGLSLTTKDFSRILQYPKSIVLGLICQVIILPLIAVFICLFFDLNATLALGVMILAASPGGPTANLYSHFAKGNVALNITLTATNSIFAIFSLPLIVNVASQYFSPDEASIGLQFGKCLQVFTLVLLPVVLGMIVNKRNTNFSKNAEKPVKIFSFLVLLVIIIVAVIEEKNNLATTIAEVGLPILIFNIASLGIGYALPSLLKVPRAESIAIAMEVGIHNGTLAIYIAMTLLGSKALALPAALYSILMFFTAGIFSVILLRSNKKEELP